MSKFNPIETADDDSLEVSKSQRKRDAHELLDLAKQLISMPETRLKRLPLDQDLRDEVGFARSIRSHGARKRQLMTVGKMLRKRDTEALLDAVNNIDEKNRQMIARHHHAEAWRDRLIAGSDRELSELLEQNQGANVQMLRQLIRNAKKEAQLNKPPAAARKLFKVLSEMNEQEALPPIPG
jgi:ribosome-associated protein